MISNILMKTGATTKAHGMIYKFVAQTALLYNSRSWVVTGGTLKVLEGFHHRAARWIVGMTDQRTEDAIWEYHLVADAIKAAGIWLIKEYIQRRKATIMAQVVYRPIYEMCTGAERMPGSSQMMRW